MNAESADAFPDSTHAVPADRNAEPSVTDSGKPSIGAIIAEILACGVIAAIALLIGTLIASIIALYLGWLIIGC